MKDKVKYLPMGLFCLFTLKAMVLGASYNEIAALAILGAYAAFYERAHNESFKKEVLEKLDGATKRFEAGDSHITQLYKNDNEILTQLKKIQLPQSIKTNGFGRM